MLLAPSILVPCLRHGGATVWDTLAIAEYLNEIRPKAGLLPGDRVARAHCRAIGGEMHSGYTSLRSALPMNLKGHFPKFKVWSRAQADIERGAADLARMPGPVWRALSFRRQARSRGRNVCAGSDSAADLRCAG